MLLHAFGIFSVVIGFCGAMQDLTLLTCSQNSTNYSSCLKHAIQESWPTFMAGVPKYYFPRLDPYYVTYHRHVYDGVMMYANIVIANTTITGIRNARLTSVKPSYKKDIFRLEVDMWLPWMICEGDNEVEGDVLGFKLSGKGHYNMTMDDIRVRWIITGPVENDRWIIEHVFINPTVENIKVSIASFKGNIGGKHREHCRIFLDDFYKNGNELNEVAEEFANDNWQVLYQTTIPVIGKTLDTCLTDYCNRFFSKVPFSKLFP